MFIRISVLALVLAFGSAAARAQTASNSPATLFAGSFARLLWILQPATNGAGATFTTTLKVLTAEGALKAVADRQLELAFRAPDHIKLRTEIEGQRFTVARNGD